ncbi:hypothetical protein M9Y10_021667 [Tritrichomonas musculus]|uniref:Kelch motif family protein n=1 Tax=Tritrichomonas musculus TaxID=1915356 RepID=A0ABR2KQ33_9EUKA
MGNNPSNAQEDQVYSQIGGDITPLNALRTRDSYESPTNSSISRNSSQNFQPIITQGKKSDFSAIWSSQVPDPPTPIARAAQCYVYDSFTNQIFIAYGMDNHQKYLNDCWSLNLSTLKWNLFKQELLSPRCYATALLITNFQSREMFIFGGYNGFQYFSDLHSINLDNGQITCYDTTASPRQSALLFASPTSIFIYSGYNGTELRSFTEYNIQTRECINTEIVDFRGRSAASFVESYDKVHWFVFGDTIGHPLLRFDNKTKQFNEMSCAGFGPPANLKNALICCADHYLFVTGGQKDSPYTYVYGLDIDRQTWLVFSIQPDGETVTNSDGCVKNGNFQVPRSHSGVMAYSPSTRSLMSVMGNRYTEPPPVQIVYIGDALSVLHLKSDILYMLSL